MWVGRYRGWEYTREGRVRGLGVRWTGRDRGRDDTDDGKLWGRTDTEDVGRQGTGLNLVSRDVYLYSNYYRIVFLSSLIS